jgi:hypothetical protein
MGLTPLLPETASPSTSRVKIGTVGVVFAFVFILEPIFLPDTESAGFLDVVPAQEHEPHAPPTSPKQLPKSTVDMEARIVGSLVQVAICVANGFSEGIAR